MKLKKFTVEKKLTPSNIETTEHYIKNLSGLKQAITEDYNNLKGVIIKDENNKIIFQKD